jgi:outer membrane receptor protein involved in Fe transport
MFGPASLKAGYELKYDRNDFPYVDARGTTVAGLTNVPALANHFLYKQTLNAVFATWERPFGELDVQAGLRVEDVRLDLRQLTSGEVHTPAYTRPYPTLHLAYKLDDAQKLTASYSERVQRPPSVFLNPLRYVIDPQNVQQGNAELKPAITRSYELGYEMKSGASDYLATLYYRQHMNEFTQLVQDIGGGVFAQTFANLGRSQYAGLELVASGKLTSKLSYNASTNIYWGEIEAGNLGFAGSRSGYGIAGRANLNWQARPDDLVQLNVYVNGRRLAAQGVFEPNGSLNLGWRHKLTDKLSATVTVQDVLGSVHFERSLDTPALIERFRVDPVARSVVVRLDYRFGATGGKGPKDPAFDYGAGAGGGGGGPGGAGPP